MNYTKKQLIIDPIYLKSPYDDLERLYKLEEAKKVEYCSDDDRTITSQQVDVVKKYIKICGFKGFADYTTKFCAKNVTEQMMRELDKLSDTINDLFPTYEVNLKRTSNRFTSSSLVMSVLRTLLTYIGIRWKSTRTKSSIYIMLVSDEICNFDKCAIKHAEYAKECIDCKALNFTVDSKKHIVETMDGYKLFILNSMENKWMKLNTKKLKLTGCTTEMLGCDYFILGGGSIIHNGKINNKNLYPVKYIPFMQTVYHDITLIINCGKKSIDSLLTFELTPYKPPSDFDFNEDAMIDIPWVYPETILRMCSGMMGLSRETPFKDTIIKYYIDDIETTADGKKILDCDKITHNLPNGLIICMNDRYRINNWLSPNIDAIRNLIDYFSVRFIFNPSDTTYEINLYEYLLLFHAKNIQVYDFEVLAPKIALADRIKKHLRTVNIKGYVMTKNIRTNQIIYSKKISHGAENKFCDDGIDMGFGMTRYIRFESLKANTLYDIKITFSLSVSK